MNKPKNFLIGNIIDMNKIINVNNLNYIKKKGCNVNITFQKKTPDHMVTKMKNSINNNYKKIQNKSYNNANNFIKLK